MKKSQRRGGRGDAARFATALRRSTRSLPREPVPRDRRALRRRSDPRSGVDAEDGGREPSRSPRESKSLSRLHRHRASSARNGGAAGRVRPGAAARSKGGTRSADTTPHRVPSASRAVLARRAPRPAGTSARCCRAAASETAARPAGDRAIAGSRDRRKGPGRSGGRRPEPPRARASSPRARRANHRSSLRRGSTFRRETGTPPPRRFGRAGSHRCECFC